MTRRSLLALSLSLSTLGCTHVERSGGNGAGGDPRPIPGVVSVDAQVTSALLADDCRTAEAPASPAPSRRAPASAIPPATPADIAPGAPSQRVCQQSTLQLALTSGMKGTPATIEIARVRMVDAASGHELADLVPRNPQVWSDASARYAPWDRTVSPSQKLMVSFDLSAPNWDAIGGGSRWNTQDMTFRVEVTLRIGGADRKLETTVRSPWLMRDPPVPT